MGGESKEREKLKDNFYNSINYKWLNSYNYLEEKVCYSKFQEIDTAVKEQLMEIVEYILKNENKFDRDSDEIKIVNLYKNITTIDEREEFEIERIKRILCKINNIKTIDDLTKLSTDMEIENDLVIFYVAKDLKNTSNFAIYIEPTQLTLDDSYLYNNPSELSKKTLDSTFEYLLDVMELLGYKKDEAIEKIVYKFKLEKYISKFIYTNEEIVTNESYYKDIYNSCTLEEIYELAPNLNLKHIFKNLKIDNINKIILKEPLWLKAINTLYSDENLHMIKAYVEVNNILFWTRYLGGEFRRVLDRYSYSIVGSKNYTTKLEFEINTLNSMLGMAIGKIYIEKYFRNSLKSNVMSLTNQIISTFKKKIDNLNNITDETKENFIKKLDNCKLNIGYPEKWIDYKNLNVYSYENGGTFIDNIIELKKFEYNNLLRKIVNEVDNEFEETPQSTNAFYDLLSNSITVPAGLINGLCKDCSSLEEYLAKIGFVIGHEISHAFDINGCNFDFNGNYIEQINYDEVTLFKNKFNTIIDFYKNVKIDNDNFVNGELTLQENIADISSMECILDILKNSKLKVKYKTFFETFASTWRIIYQEKYLEHMISNDVHLPNMLRVNCTIQQFEIFYKTYNISEGDGMYILPQNRISLYSN